jgi:hypothetical protein
MIRFSLKRIIIINIVKDDVIKERINYGNSLYSEIIIYQIKHNEFFTKEKIQFLFIENKEDIKNMIFIFSGYK